MSKPDSLSAEALRGAPGEAYIGREIVVVAEATSTNDLAWRMAQEGKPDGLVVFAERQTAGRGQRGNHWESTAHLGLWFSILLRPGIEPADSSRLTDWAAQNIAQTIQEQTQVEARIKMPNDIYVLQRKVAGVLVELRVEKNGAYAGIAGIGVNVNQTAADFSETIRAGAGSLAMATGRKIDRQTFALALLRNLDRTYRALFTT
jgi:BirA family transcriptional regulator, biotin operon repressor / biotin---[acetyl-CoA-carboxylase] ligase